jgi:hypothetical protein
MRKRIAKVQFEILINGQPSDALTVTVYGLSGQFQSVEAIEQEARRLAPQHMAGHEKLGTTLVIERVQS